MRSNPTVFGCSISGLAIVLAAGVARGQVELITDGGFETTDPLAQVDPLPGDGVWFADLAERTTARDGIEPAEGSRMLRFVGTRPTGPGGTDSALWQLVSVEDHADLIDGDGATLAGRALFNRIAGTDSTDTEFRVSIRAYPTRPAVLGDLTSLATVSDAMSIFSDADVATWESAEASLLLPAGTRWVAMTVSAQENVSPSSSPEFEGHYADATSLVLEAVSTCAADIDMDGELTIFDFLAFQNLFDAGDLAADFDGDGALTLFDFLAFQNAFDAGC